METEKQKLLKSLNILFKEILIIKENNMYIEELTKQKNEKNVFIIKDPSDSKDWFEGIILSKYDRGKIQEAINSFKEIVDDYDWNKFVRFLEIVDPEIEIYCSSELEIVEY